jgi:hypothetical protein
MVEEKRRLSQFYEMMEVLRRKMVMQTATTSIKKSPTLAVLKGITVC